MKFAEVTSVTEYVKIIEEYSNETDNWWFRGVPKTEQKPVPSIIWRDALSLENSLEHRFLVRYKSYLDQSDLNNWEIYALMQHHGLPTRLLDWSNSALVALYFALSSEPEYVGVRCVWAIDPYELNRVTVGDASTYCPAVLSDREIFLNGLNLDEYLPPNLKPAGVKLEVPEKPIAIDSTRHIKRVSSQQGCFTVHGSSPEHVGTYLESTDFFRKIEVNITSNEERLEMLKALSLMGIDEEFIFQDLDALCRKIKRELLE